MKLNSSKSPAETYVLSNKHEKRGGGESGRGNVKGGGGEWGWGEEAGEHGLKLCRGYVTGIPNDLANLN